jgi:uncharacterized protein with PQ loop repeat
MASCDSGANEFIKEHFHDCIYTDRDLVGFCFGMLSISLWLFAQIPQFYSNYKNQSSEALSVWFIAEWFMGDTLNLLGCLVSGTQLATTTYLAMYFVVSDVFLLLQFIYYGALQRQKARKLRHRHKGRHHRNNHSRPDSGVSVEGTAGYEGLGITPLPSADLPPHLTSTVVSSRPVVGATVIATAVGTVVTVGLMAVVTHVGPAGVHARILQQVSHFGDHHNESLQMLGLFMGYGSSVLYLMSRVSQIIKNCSRHSSEGLALGMFVFTIFANLSTTCSILLRANTMRSLKEQLPWVVGSAGTTWLDFVILVQTYRSRKAAEALKRLEGVETPLILSVH